MGSIIALKYSRKTYLRMIISAILLYTLYKVGLPVYFIIGMGVLILLLALSKEKLYGKLDAFLNAKLPFPSKQNSWVKKLVVIIAFMMAYILLKQVIFFILAQFGIDVQKMIMDSVN